MFNEIKSWIIGNGLSLLWTILCPFFIKFVWDSLFNLRILAIVAFILGFVVIWQIKRIQELNKAVKYLSPPQKSKREELEDKVLLLIDEKNEQYQKISSEIDNITGNITVSVDLLQVLICKGYLYDGSLRTAIAGNKVCGYFLLKGLTIEGKERVEQIKKSRLLQNN